MQFLKALKPKLKELLPTPLHPVFKFAFMPEERARQRLKRAFIRRYGHLVKAGPFEGMKYIDKSFWSEYQAKLVGTYEKELTTVIKGIDSRFDGLIDIGAAEGYYVAGLLRKLPSLTCTAFEASDMARKLLDQLATLNSVRDRLLIEGLCTPDDLNSALAKFQRPFLISDCEGAEFELLDPVAVPALKSTTMLVEVHGHTACPPGPHPDHPTALLHCLNDRFRATHRLTVIPYAARTDEDWPTELADLGTLEERRLVMDEHRWQGPGWLVLECGA